MPRPKTDPDRADEGAPANVDPNAPQAGSSAPGMFAPRGIRDPQEPAPETPRQAASRRVKGAQFLGGVWYAADGSPLTDKEAQQAHRAMDAAAAEARAKILRGEA